MIAVLLMALMGVTTVGVIVASGRMSASNAQQARALAFADEWLEQIMHAPYADVVPGGRLPSGAVVPEDGSLREFTGVGDLGDDPQWSIEITDVDEFHRLVTLTIQWTDPITGRLARREFRCYRYDDAIVRYPCRGTSG
jgi:hypothetical protein